MTEIPEHLLKRAQAARDKTSEPADTAPAEIYEPPVLTYAKETREPARVTVGQDLRVSNPTKSSKPKEKKPSFIRYLMEDKYGEPTALAMSLSVILFVFLLMVLPIVYLIISVELFGAIATLIITPILGLAIFLGYSYKKYKEDFLPSREKKK